MSGDLKLESFATLCRTVARRTFKQATGPAVQSLVGELCRAFGVVYMVEARGHREIHWRDYLLNADLYKFYMDMTLKVNIAFYGITGAIVSFCVTYSQAPLAPLALQAPGARWALLLPAAMGLCLAFIFAYSSYAVVIMRNDMRELCEKLRLDSYHDFTPLIFALVAFALLQVVCFVGLFWLFLKMHT
jgi:hypothetical protein